MTRLFHGVIPIERMTMFGDLRPKPDARMLRSIAVMLKVPPSRCILVEDTLAHQKSARRVGMKTVWMQRWMRRAGSPAPVSAGLPARPRRCRRPTYVCARIRSLQALSRSAW